MNALPLEVVRETGFAECTALEGRLNGDDFLYPDLVGWTLMGADLSGAELFFGNLTSATLHGADLSDLHVRLRDGERHVRRRRPRARLRASAGAVESAWAARSSSACGEAAGVRPRRSRCSRPCSRCRAPWPTSSRGHVVDVQPLLAAQLPRVPHARGRERARVPVSPRGRRRARARTRCWRWWRAGSCPRPASTRAACAATSWAHVLSTTTTWRCCARGWRRARPKARARPARQRARRPRTGRAMSATSLALAPSDDALWGSSAVRRRRDRCGSSAFLVGVRMDAPAAAHHAMVFTGSMTTRGSRASLGRAHGVPRALSGESGALAFAWVPGRDRVSFPAGTGVPLGARVIVQLHEHGVVDAASARRSRSRSRTKWRGRSRSCRRRWRAFARAGQPDVSLARRSRSPRATSWA